MKKTYISPDMNVITIEQHLMADPTSAPGVGINSSGSVDAGSVESRRGGLWDDDDED